MTDEDLDLGTCCACQNPDKQVRNIMSLGFRTPYSFGWGCFQCGLPMEGAIAVLCDECLESDAEIREFVKGEALEKQRAPIAELTEPFDHDLSKHPEAQVPTVPLENWGPSIVVERHNLDESERVELEEMGVEFEDDPVVLYDPETGPVTDSQLRRIVEEVVAQRREPQTVEVHNVYTLYELNEDGSTAEQKLVCFNRPQDWGDPRWHYHRCKTKFESNGTCYINHCHLWQEVERNPVEAFQAIAPYLFMVLQPGTKPELCSKDFMEPEDFWLESWGKMPPVFEDREDWEDYGYDDEPGILAAGALADEGLLNDEDITPQPPVRVGVSREEYQQLSELTMPCEVKALQHILKDERADLIFSESFHDREVELFIVQEGDRHD
jgi:hypothetical protein